MLWPLGGAHAIRHAPKWPSSKCAIDAPFTHTRRTRRYAPHGHRSLPRGVATRRKISKDPSRPEPHSGICSLEGKKMRVPKPIVSSRSRLSFRRLRHGKTRKEKRGWRRSIGTFEIFSFRKRRHVTRSDWPFASAFFDVTSRPTRTKAANPWMAVGYRGRDQSDKEAFLSLSRVLISQAISILLHLMAPTHRLNATIGEIIAIRVSLNDAVACLFFIYSHLYLFLLNKYVVQEQFLVNTCSTSGNEAATNQFITFPQEKLIGCCVITTWQAFPRPGVQKS